MKRILLASAFLAIALLPARSQELTYALPFTSIGIKVEAERTTHYAGPYASYAKDMLNIEVPLIDKTETHVTNISLVPRTEADPWAPRLSCPQDAYPMLELTAQGLVSLGYSTLSEPVRWRFDEKGSADFGVNGITDPRKKEKGKVKTTEEKARAAADMILQVRKDRLNIAIGNTDASYSGESLSAALGELSRIEEEYLLLFTGYSETDKFEASFEVLPSATARSHRYPAFVLTVDGTLASTGEGTLYEIELTPVSVPEVKAEAEPVPGKKPVVVPTVHYRIPSICSVRLMEEGMPILETRMPIYQLGREAELPIKTK